jgi:hypothetical protein
MHAAPSRPIAVRRARAAVLSAAAALVLLQGGLRLYVEHCDPALRDPEYTVRLARLRQGGTGPDRPLRVVMLGSSRTLCGLRAASLGESLTSRLGRPVQVENFGEPGFNPAHHLFRWRRLRHDGVRPDLLLVEVMPAHLNASRPLYTSREARFYPTERLRRSDLATVEFVTGEHNPGLRRQWWLDQGFPWYAHREELLRRWVHCFLPAEIRGRLIDALNDCGDMILPAAKEQLMRTPQARARAHQEYAVALADFHRGGTGCAALHQLLEDCRTDGVPVVLVLMPEGPAFRGWFPESIHRQTRAWLEQLRAEYGVTVVDARDWIGEEEFYDSHHLIGAGSVSFTERLGREAVLPLLQGTASPVVAAQGPRQ